MIKVFASRLLATGLYSFGKVFYRFEVSWVNPPAERNFQAVRVFAFLNHTSLLEPLFLGAFPYRFIWDAARRTTVPGADITLNRPLAGFFYKIFTPRTVSISRKRDATWQGFLEQIPQDALVAIAPEGRMKRPNGLDKHGQPMTVRGGITDILAQMQEGKFLIAYSGGLHHVNQPGSRKVAVFKTLKMKFEILDIASYLSTFPECEHRELRLLIARDLERRQALHTPQ